MALNDDAQQARLYPWLIVRLLPKMQRVSIGRFRKRVYAEGHLRLLRQAVPQASFAIVFDCEPFDCGPFDCEPQKPANTPDSGS
ncbi:hypothetical protein [Leptolyngbya sp. FACHB-261]|uniref:hypothetical protein n=1 Tax=Leptolyngbya sp. FACHB-261 TaxID=2692806 RepID=UPI0016847708|nr:hypothetical protein [Leptolyngbya sp. FACHB-261]MBD2100534.1 hypothetical protein [Leptolyngbya sp. FACHB-261]